MNTLKQIKEGFFNTTNSGIISLTRNLLIELGMIEDPKDPWTIHSDGVVDCKSVIIKDKNITEIPVQFGVVETFDISWCEKLTTLKGSPKTISYEFNCKGCVGLKSFEFISKPSNDYVNYRLSGCKDVAELAYLPEKCRLLDIDGTSIKTLKGPVKEVIALDVNNMKKLKNFDGCPEILFKLRAQDCNVDDISGLPNIMPRNLQLTSKNLNEWNHTTTKLHPTNIKNGYGSGSRSGLWKIKLATPCTEDDIRKHIQCKVPKDFTIVIQAFY